MYHPAGVSDVACDFKLHYSTAMDTPPTSSVPAEKQPAAPAEAPKEIGGSNKPEPTRYGDWEIGGRCADF